MPALQLSVKPTLQLFNWTQDRDAQNKIADALEAQAKATELISIRTPQQIMFNSKGYLGDNLRFSAPALPSVCGLLVQGLSQMTKSLCSGRGKTQEDAEPELALQIYNDLVKRRFKRVAGRLLVVDKRTGTVDGVISERYAYLSNAELFERTQEFIRKAPQPAKFHTGSLYGRRLLLRYRHPDPLFTVPTERKTDEPFFGGYHFCNSESGDCTVRGAVLIIRQFCDNQAIGELAEGGRISHVRNAAFEEKLGKLFEKLRKKSEETSKYKDNVQRLLDEPLGLDADAALYAARVKSLLSQLTRFGLTAGMSRVVLGHALAAGSYSVSVNVDAADRGWLDRSREGYARRNEYDVFNALTNVSKSLEPSARERLEQIAFGMLTGRHRFKPGVVRV